MDNQEKLKKLESLLGKHISRGSEYFPDGKPTPKKSILDIIAEAVSINYPAGRVILIQKRIPLDSSQHPDSPIQLAGIEEDFDSFRRKIETQRLISRLSNEKDLTELNLEGLYFLDTETTGLAGGTGTLPFMVGLGNFSDGEFILRQFFIEDFSDEPALISELKRIIESENFQAVCTYNGIAYDIPILRSRFILNKVRYFWDIPNVDLLFVIRRIFKLRLSDCSLANIEREILGVLREDDFPGFMIPQLYFDYTRGLRREVMPRVFAHNRYDIISLAGLFLKVTGLLLNSEEEILIHPEDCFGLGRVFENINEHERALALFQRALKICDSPQFSYHILHRIGRRYKKIGDWEKAIGIWREMMNFDSSFGLQPYLELAKYFEHGLKDYERAIEITERALGILKLEAELNEYLEDSAEKVREELKGLHHRYERLLRKQEKKE